MPDSHFHPVLENGFAVKDIAEHCNVTLGDDEQANFRIYGVASLLSATPCDLVYCTQKSFVEDLKKTRAGLCLVKKEFAQYVPSGSISLIVSNPALAYARIAALLYPSQENAVVHPTALISSSATIGRNVAIGPYAVVGDHVKIGDNCRIGSHCSITHAEIGFGTIVYAGARIGQDGFGYVFDTSTGRHVKIPQLGRVIIGNNVEIGANVTIDRGAMEDTVIGDNCIIDNLVQIGHNVRLGRGVILVAQSGIAGSSKLDDYAVVAAQGGVADHVHIGKGAQIGAQSGIMRDVPAGEKLMGTPAMPIKQYLRQFTMLKKMMERKS